MITGFCVFFLVSLEKHLRFDCWSLFNTFLASYLQLDSVFCNLGESARLFLFGFFPLFWLTLFLLWLFFTVGLLLYFAHDHTPIHTGTQTDLPSVLFPLFIRWLRFFLLFYSFFCTASPVHIHFLCLSILFLSNMLLADTLFSSRLPLLALRYNSVFVWGFLRWSRRFHTNTWVVKQLLLLSLVSVKVIYCVVHRTLNPLA